MGSMVATREIPDRPRQAVMTERKSVRYLIFLLLCPSFLFMGVTQVRAQQFTPVTDSQKTDVLLLRNGVEEMGDFRQLQRGIVTLKTDAAGTIYVKWPRVVTATTDKRFEIHLEDGRFFYGSLQSSDNAYRVIIRAVSDTLEVPTQSIVEMVRLKKTFWQRLDGSLDLGLNFTQQNAKVDIQFDFQIGYAVEHNRFGLRFDGSFSRQDSVSDIQRRDLAIFYGREFSKMWFLGVTSSAQRNTQLSLDLAFSIGAGPGRVLIATNRVSLTTWVGPFFRRELYLDEDPRNTVPLSAVTDFQWFSWSGLSTDLSSRLTISPILNNSGRWQIRFNARLKQELLSLLYLTVGINEVFDSNPPGDANKNDFSLTTSLGWSF